MRMISGILLQVLLFQFGVLAGAFTTSLEKYHTTALSMISPESQNENKEPGNDSILYFMKSQRISKKNQEEIMGHVKRTKLCDDEFGSPDTLLFVARDFVDRPEMFSSLLMSDFDFPPLIAHQTRALVMGMIKSQEARDAGTENALGIPSVTRVINNSEEKPKGTSLNHKIDPTSNVENDKAKETIGQKENPNRLSQADTKPLHKNFKKTVVNEKAQKRREASGSYEYGLPSDYKIRFPKLASELADFFLFMTQPSTSSQEDPIRPATAEVYMRHARQFLGWYVTNSYLQEAQSDSELSLFRLVPNTEKESATEIINFVLWLRSRKVSVSYEANILRGLIKLLKYRFAQESKSDSSYGGNTFDDIPVIKETRKLHRDANKRQRLAPRSSDEQSKWLSWPEYLKVVENTKCEVLQMVEDYHKQPPSERKYRKGDTDRTYTVEQANVAEAYQRYLILAIFANIPDRQRTIRELEIKKTLVKDEKTGCWVVKHGPDDYKTGKSYGERPAMPFAKELSPVIDDFIDNWRPALCPSTEFLFAQSRTGKPLTGDSVFQRVSRSCFKYTGKRTNPHLLRDMIVTHVRESDASEKELEALALFMGHSLHMQRTSYDRRTLTNKIAPAVRLMQSVNKVE